MLWLIHCAVKTASCSTQHLLRPVLPAMVPKSKSNPSQYCTLDKAGEENECNLKIIAFSTASGQSIWAAKWVLAEDEIDRSGNLSIKYRLINMLLLCKSVRHARRNCRTAVIINCNIARYLSLDWVSEKDRRKHIHQSSGIGVKEWPSWKCIYRYSMTAVLCSVPDCAILLLERLANFDFTQPCKRVRSTHEMRWWWRKIS